jgi:hypothetical protein
MLSRFVRDFLIARPSRYRRIAVIVIAQPGMHVPTMLDI